MRSAIISVGTELLFGKVVNTNAAYLSQELNEMGIDVMYHYTMGDNPERLARMLKFAFEDCDMLIITGGLGPTEDDLTKETVCEYMGIELRKDDEIADGLIKYFERTGYIYTENNMKQAYVPVGGTIFRNTAGTAPGFAVERDGKRVVCMPGVPREMKKMFSESVKPYLMAESDACIYSKSVRVFGVGESLTETMLLPFIDGQTDPTIATYAKEGIVEVRITSKRRTEAEAAAAVNDMLGGVMDVLGDSVFTQDGLEIQQEVAKRLIERNISISCCESPTAGKFASMLADVPGISEVFSGGYIIYDENAAKELMAIPDELMEAHTLYSSEAADAMARKLHEKTGCRMCAAITGVAGPDPVGDIAPGMYNISVLFDGKLYSRKYNRRGRTRELNREFMAQSAFDMILRIIDGKKMTEVR